MEQAHAVCVGLTFYPNKLQPAHACIMANKQMLAMMIAGVQ
jgi:hypothetical protein